METTRFLIQLVLILLSARILGEIAAYFKIPSVIGELFAGIILGPSLLGWIEISSAIQLLAQIGIILLLFEVGLETDINRLITSGRKAFIVAIAGVIFPFLGGFGISFYLFKFSLLLSLFIGSTLTATSIGITLRVLRDLNVQRSGEAQIIIGAAVLDDIVGIVLLSMLYEFSSRGEVNLWSASKVLLLISLFFILSPFLAAILSKTIKKWDESSKIPGLLPATIVALILFFAWIAHQLGAPELLGGFAAGLALSSRFIFPFATFLHQDKEFSHRVGRQMKPLIHLFTPIFFVAIGLSLNLKDIDWGSKSIWMITLTLTLVAILGKLISGFLLLKESHFRQLVIGTSMIPRGEVGLVFANVGLTTGIFNTELFAAIILVIAITTLLPPFALKKIYDAQKA